MADPAAASGQDGGPKETPPTGPLSVLEKLEVGKGLKDEGNEAFKQGNLPAALKLYHQAIFYLKGLDSGSLASLIPSATMKPETKADIARTLMACYSNMAACHLKREHWSKAIQCCGSVLALDPSNVKGYFRRGQGRMGLGDFDQAAADFKRAAELSPQDALVRQSLAEARQRQQEQEERARAELKHVYSRALSASGGNGTGAG